jgi:hypothetical protein
MQLQAGSTHAMLQTTTGDDVVAEFVLGPHVPWQQPVICQAQSLSVLQEATPASAHAPPYWIATPAHSASQRFG